MIQYCKSRSGLVIVLFATLTAKHAVAQEGGFRAPIKVTRDAFLVCRIGPHRLTQGQKCTMSETLKCNDYDLLRGVEYQVHRLGFFHRALNRMVMMDSGEWVGGIQGLRSEVSGSIVPTQRSEAGQPYRRSEFCPQDPGIFTINVIWTIRRQKVDGSDWLELVESGPVLLIVQPTDEWLKRVAATIAKSKESDLFAVEDQLAMECRYPHGEHDP